MTHPRERFIKPDRIDRDDENGTVLLMRESRCDGAVEELRDAPATGLGADDDHHRVAFFSDGSQCACGIADLRQHRRLNRPSSGDLADDGPISLGNIHRPGVRRVRIDRFDDPGPVRSVPC